MKRICADSLTESLLERIKRYSFPGGEAAVRGVRGIRTTQRGEIRSDPNGRWLGFTAEEFVDAMRSGFCWNAHMGSGLKAVNVTDAYEDGHGRVVVRKGPLQLKRLVGPDVDKGELQRYLAYVSYCPPILLNNASMEFSATDAGHLHLRDRADATSASVDIEVEENGCPAVARTVRPMIAGKRIQWVPWSAMSSDFEELDGLCIPKRLEASWDLPDGGFTYIRIEVLTYEVLR